VNQNLDRLARFAMNSIENLLAGKKQSKGREVLPELVIRNSTENNNVQRVTRARKKGR